MTDTSVTGFMALSPDTDYIIWSETEGYKFYFDTAQTTTLVLPTQLQSGTYTFYIDSMGSRPVWGTSSIQISTSGTCIVSSV